MMYDNVNPNLEACSDEQLCTMAQQGDRAAEELLAVRYFSVVKACSRPYFLAGGDGEDLIQEGMLGLLKAVRAYEVGRNVPFEAFARMCITRRVYSAVSAASAAKHEPLNHSESIAKTPLFDENSKAVHVVSDPVNLVIDMEEYRERHQKLEASLSAFESRVLALYLDGCSYEEMAAEVGKPVKSVDNAIQRIRRKAAALFPDEYR
ncbi:MAG: sigma-70 family RNA polymerase sigma factor [Clostridia bacterium]|nr:sigma-70 family RNA polymerase sigma factor [Clostridia bacterium]